MRGGWKAEPWALLILRAASLGAPPAPLAGRMQPVRTLGLELLSCPHPWLVHSENALPLFSCIRWSGCRYLLPQLWKPCWTDQWIAEPDILVWDWHCPCTYGIVQLHCRLFPPVLSQPKKADQRWDTLGLLAVPDIWISQVPDNKIYLSDILSRETVAFYMILKNVSCFCCDLMFA